MLRAQAAVAPLRMLYNLVGPAGMERIQNVAIDPIAHAINARQKRSASRSTTGIVGVYQAAAVLAAAITASLVYGHSRRMLRSEVIAPAGHFLGLCSMALVAHQIHTPA